MYLKNKNFEKIKIWVIFIGLIWYIYLIKKDVYVGICYCLKCFVNSIKFVYVFFKFCGRLGFYELFLKFKFKLFDINIEI